MDLKPKVYVLVDNPKSPINFLPATKYGEIFCLFDHNISPTYLQRIQPDLERKLEVVREEDYLIPTGPPSLIALAGHIWLDKVGVINLLTWDRETQQYFNVRATA